jgi:outer membrane biosynthesis protein TonB
MKQTIVIALLLFIVESYTYEVIGQTDQSGRQKNTGTTDTIKKDTLQKDTVFFEIGPEHKHAFIDFEEMPEFPGGEKAMIKYISENTNYPQSAIKDSITGQVNLVFKINTDGTTSIVKIYKGVQNDIDTVCIRVIKGMPKWKPGSTVIRAKKGLYRTTVPVYYFIRFIFVLGNEQYKNGIIIRPR